VTGAASGIGLATARRLAAAGTPLCLLDRDGAKLRAVARDLDFGEASLAAVVCDVQREASVTRALKTARRTLGLPLLGLVNNAGFGGPFERLTEVKNATFDAVFDTNVRGPFFFCRALLPEMARLGFGRIVNVASIQGTVGAPLSSTYVASKHALLGYTKAIAAEWGGLGVTCNAVLPGFVKTAMGVQPARTRNHGARVLRRSVVKRLATPDEIARTIQFLLHPDSGFINGAELKVDGGMTADLGMS